MPRPDQLLQQNHNSEPIFKIDQAQELQFQANAKDVAEKQKSINFEGKFELKPNMYVKRYVNDNYIEQHHIDTAFNEAMEKNNFKKNYGQIKKAKQGEKKKYYDVQNSRGSQYMLEGESVLQFDFGGTGAKYLERGRMDRKYPTADIYGHGMEMPVKDMELTSKFGRFMRACFSWLPGVWSTKKRDDYVTKYNAAAKYNREQIKKNYGESVTLVDKKGKKKTFEHIRRKDEVNSETEAVKTRYTFAGPTLLNGGDYQMENLEEYALALGSAWLAPKLKKIADLAGDGEVPADVKPLHVMLQGHSRGGVAASMAAMRLNKWLYDHFDEKIAKLVIFDTIQYDPVPGKFSRTGIREVADLGTEQYYDKNGNVTANKAEAKYRSLGEQQNSTVVYCLRTFKDHWFTPQQIRGTKRIIFTVRDHNAIFSHETNKKFGSDVKEHRSPYIDVEKNKAFRGSAVNQMDEGIYFADGNNVLHRVHNLGEYQDMCDKLLPQVAKDHQKKRQDVLDAVAEAWFEKEFEKEIGSNEENAHYKQNKVKE